VSQESLDDLFERNADMRLLERRHKELGGATTDGKARRVGGGFGAESIVPGTVTDQALENSPLLRVEIAAAPLTGIIPGAVIGVAIDVSNDGGAPAPEATLQISLPIESQYRDGSLRLDGREVAASEQLFADGLPIPALAGSSAVKVTFQLQVLAGLTALILQPRLRADGVPIVGTVGISIKRGPAAATAPPAQAPQRPFYELEEDEVDEVAGEAAAEPILPPVLPPVPIEAKPAPAKAKRAPAKAARVPLPLPEPEPVPEPLPEPVPEAIAPPPVQPEPEPEPEPEPVAPVAAVAPAAPAAREVPAELRSARYRPVGSAEISVLERLFAAEAPGPIAHLMTISLLACTQDASGDDVGHFDAAVRRNGETLGRALVLQKLGKPTAFLVTQGQLDALASDGAPVPATPPERPTLRRIARRQDTSTIASLLHTSDRDATIRFHLALLAIGAEAVDGIAHAGLAADTALNLVSYRANAVAWLGPACVASAGHVGNALPMPPAPLDAAGRRLLTSLKAALA
jgi:outer membrane biosynthesis protein TonB